MNRLINRWEQTIEGVTYQVDLIADPEYTPAEFTTEKEDPRLFAHWHRGDFEYVGVIVTAYGFQASVWGVDYGTPGAAPEGTNTQETINRDYVPDLVAEILDQVHTNGAGLRALLNAARTR